MCSNNFNIELTILDTWEVDTYSKGYIKYILVEVAGKLHLWEKYFNETL